MILSMTLNIERRLFPFCAWLEQFSSYPQFSDAIFGTLKGKLSTKETVHRAGERGGRESVSLRPYKAGGEGRVGQSSRPPCWDLAFSSPSPPFRSSPRHAQQADNVENNFKKKHCNPQVLNNTVFAEQTFQANQPVQFSNQLDSFTRNSLLRLIEQVGPQGLGRKGIFFFQNQIHWKQITVLPRPRLARALADRFGLDWDTSLEILQFLHGKLRCRAPPPPPPPSYYWPGRRASTPSKQVWLSDH